MPDRRLAPEAQPWVRPVAEALASLDLARGFHGRWTTRDGVRELPVRNTNPIVVTPQPRLPGTWQLHVSWTLRRVPGGNDITVWQSSTGLSVRGVAFAPEADARFVCLVRYDVDHGRLGPNLAPLGRHLNVLQPSPLLDNAHFAIPGDEAEWHVPHVLHLLLAPEFFQDLVDRM